MLNAVRRFVRQQTLVSRARAFAYRKFAGRRDRQGYPMILHSETVAQNFWHDSILMAIAYLHDTIEDTDTTEKEILDLFGERVSHAVNALTRYPGQGWNPYIRQVMENPDARKVKIADIKHNLSRMDQQMSDKSRGGEMYRETLEVLERIESVRV